IVGEPADAPSKERLTQAGVSGFIPNAFNPGDAAKTIASLYQERIDSGGPGHPVVGSFDEMTAVDLLRALGAAKKSGKVAIRNGSHEGYLQLENGKVVFASYGKKEGDPALYTLLTLKSADFTYDPEALLMDMPQMEKDPESIAREVAKVQQATAAQMAQG